MIKWFKGGELLCKHYASPKHGFLYSCRVHGMDLITSSTMSWNNGYRYFRVVKIIAIVASTRHAYWHTRWKLFLSQTCWALVTNYPSYNLMSVIDFAIICIPRKEWLWQQFLSRFANFFAKLFLLFECLADWEKITSNGFLYIDPEMLLHDKDMVRISTPGFKWA